MPRPRLDVAAYRMLLADWFRRLAKDAGWELGHFGGGGEGYTFGTPGVDRVEALFTDARPFLRFVAQDDERQHTVQGLVKEAVSRTERLDLGGTIWYSTTLEEVAIALSGSSFMGILLERLGGQVRIAGWRRLGRDILLEFAENETGASSDPKRLFAPKAVVHAHVAAPGPIHGHFSSHVAHNAIELVGAICTFALGRPVQLPHVMFPADDEHVERLDNQRTNEGILTLARKGVGLNIFGFVGLEGGLELFGRVKSALLTFDAAMRQEHDSVATLLYLVAADGLMYLTQGAHCSRLRFRR